jgi:hypothetical protein
MSGARAPAFAARLSSSCPSLITSTRRCPPACIFVRVQPFTATRFGVPLPHPTPYSRAPGFATQERDRERDSRNAPGNTQDMGATSANPFKKVCQATARPEGSDTTTRGFHLLERWSAMDLACKS